MINGHLSYTRFSTTLTDTTRFFPKPDLRELLTTARERFPILEEFEVDGDRVLQVLTLSYGHTNGRSPEPSRSGLLALDPEYVEANWIAATQALSDAYRWVKSQGARPETLPNTGIVVAIGGMLFFNSGIFKQIGLSFSSTLRRWYFSRVLREGASGGANSRIAADFGELMRHCLEKRELYYPDVLMTVKNIENLTSAQDNRFKAIQCVIAIHGTEDILSQENLSDESAIEHHHIFPRSLAKRYGWGGKVDSIANLIATSKASNRKISDKGPQDYLGSLNTNAIKNGTSIDLRRRLEKALIPFTELVGTAAWNERLSPELFRPFLSARAAILHQKIGELIGTSLVNKDATGLDQDPDPTEISEDGIGISPQKD